MEPVGKLEAEVEVKSSADKIFKSFGYQAHQVATATPEKVHSVDVHEGDYETKGSIKTWKYTINGSTEYYKEKMDIDEQNKVVILTGVEGHLLDRYKTFKGTLHFIPKGDAALVKVVLEYGKTNENVSPPKHYLEFACSVIKDLDEHLCKA